jgi:threonine/homoserine efflux transporter RhtA
MVSELIWGAITLFGIILTIKYKSSFKQRIGPMIIGFTGALWIAYIFG